MSLWVIVPVKPLNEGKSRLAGVLSAGKRRALARMMLENTLKILSAAEAVERVLVVSRDPIVLALARGLGAESLLEVGPPELNASLEFATRFARQHGASMTLALPADLPLVTAGDIQALVDCMPADECVVIAPDRREEGTNALLTRPPGIIPYMFGVGSFKRHFEEARQNHIEVTVCQRAGFGLDIDLPEDLDFLHGA